SRRRHTRWPRDWSSDVCSSDLRGPAGCKSACDAWGMELAGMVKMGEYSDGCICQVMPSTAAAPSGRVGASIPAAAAVYVQMQVEIGRASCRERVYGGGGAGGGV